MPSYAITGASRGIGLGFIKALAVKPETQVFAIIRNPSTAETLNEFASSHPNVHIIIAEVTDGKQMQEAATKVGEITGGKLDVLIANAGAVGSNVMKVPGDWIGKPEEAKADLDETFNINFYSVIYTVNAFLPLILAGETKKIISLTTGMADEDFILESEAPSAVGYVTSKAALNAMIAKYANQYKSENVKFLSLSPGWVRTEANAKVVGGLFAYMLSAFQKVDPSVEGMMTVEQSVEEQLAMIDRLTLDDSGRFLSQHGTKHWF